jgi:diguanylate cyclase (GGDEF)-like protein/PAS domain S-box-containing protein
VVDTDLVIKWQSPAAARQFGLSDQDVLGRPFAALVHPEDAGRVVEALAEVLAGREPGLIGARLHDGFGRWRDTESTVNDLRDVPAVGALVVHVRDVGERRELERTLQRMAFTDQLTGLANRREALRTLAARRLEDSGCVLAVDLDGLTGVNDVRGHEVGDAVLIEVARRLRSGVDETDVVARLGGDEFLVLTGTGQVRAYALAMRLLTVLGEPYRLPGATVHLTATIGLAEVSGASTVDEVLGRADLALRRAKRAGRGRVEWYDESMAAALLRRMTLEQELPGAPTRGELDLVYQPVVELAYRNPVGVEALLRWRHPRLGTVLPAEVVPVAEELGLADELAAWVLHRACRQLAEWRRDGWDLWLSVNASPVQLAAPGFAEALTEATGAHLLPPSRLLVEVPAAPDLGDALERARGAGVHTALDHFGSGPVSLADLRGLAVDVLKVDRSLFVEPAAPILDVVVGLAERLGLQVVAEALEDEAHLDAVRAAGCRLGQGYLFARPTPAEHLEAYLEEHRTHML